MSVTNITPNPSINGLIENCGYAAAALTILPIPGSEILGVMPLHVGMVVGIAEHHDRQLTRETATELVMHIGATVGASLVGSRIATTAAKIILPGFGGLVAAPFMFASTLGIGVIADQWFRQEGNLDAATMKDLYQQTMRTAKSGYSSDKAKSDTAMAAAKAAQREDKGAQGPTSQQDANEDDTSMVARLRKAKALLDEGLIEKGEYEALKKRVIDSI